MTRCEDRRDRVKLTRHRQKGGLVAPRFLQLADVAEVLSISGAQAYALVRSGELPAIKVGGRGQWRVEAAELERYIERCYAQTRAFVAAHPLGDGGDAGDDAIGR